MKNTFCLLIITPILIGLNAPSAHAWWGKKLDLNAIQGRYTLVIKQHMSLTCPDSITVVYDEKNASLDSEAFHFSNIGGKSKSMGQDFDPGHAAYSDQWVVTRVHSHSITESQVTSMTSSDTSAFPLDPGPLDVPPPGSPASMHLAVSNSVITTTLKYNTKTKVLEKTIDMDGQALDGACTFEKAQ